jgi:hypothetical protein
MNSAGLSANLAGIHRLGISLFIFSIKWISVGFYLILLDSANFFPKINEIRELNFLVSTDFLTLLKTMGEATLLALDANAPTGKTKFSAN